MGEERDKVMVYHSIAIRRVEVKNNSNLTSKVVIS